MSRFRHTDILVELIELCHERMNEIRTQLSYYRASVYKGETATQIEERMEHLRLIAGLFGDETLADAFTDCDAVKAASVNSPGFDYVPGECSFSKRVSMLLKTLDENLERLHQGTFARESQKELQTAFTDAVKAQKTQLLAICRAGSRQWSFFSAL